MYKDVPVSDNEDNNAVLKTWAPEERKAEHKKDGIPHHGVLARLDGCVDLFAFLRGERLPYLC